MALPDTSTIVSVGTAAAGYFALFYAAKSYWLKTGLEVRGSFVVASSIDCDDAYVSNIIIENLKDRATVVFQVLLEVNHGYFIELEDFTDAPLIIHPFEAYTKSFDPIQFYGVSLRRISLNELLNDRTVRKRLVLSTSEGRYDVKPNTKRWNPAIDFFRNYTTALIRPVRKTYKNVGYGSNVRYLVEFRLPKGKEEVVALRPDDHQMKVFKNFSLTLEALSSKSSLESFLVQQVVNGSLACDDFTIYDLSEGEDHAKGLAFKDTITAHKRGYFLYAIVGRLVTLYDNFKMHRDNRRRRG